MEVGRTLHEQVIGRLCNTPLHLLIMVRQAKDGDGGDDRCFELLVCKPNGRRQSCLIVFPPDRTFDSVTKALTDLRKMNVRGGMQDCGRSR